MTMNFQKAWATISPGLSRELDACSIMVLSEDGGGIIVYRNCVMGNNTQYLILQWKGIMLVFG